MIGFVGESESRERSQRAEMCVCVSEREREREREIGYCDRCCDLWGLETLEMWKDKHRFIYRELKMLSDSLEPAVLHVGSRTRVVLCGHRPRYYWFFLSHYITFKTLFFFFLIKWMYIFFSNSYMVYNFFFFFVLGGIRK